MPYQPLCPLYTPPLLVLHCDIWGGGIWRRLSKSDLSFQNGCVAFAELLIFSLQYFTSTYAPICCSSASAALWRTTPLVNLKHVIVLCSGCRRWSSRSIRLWRKLDTTMCMCTTATIRRVLDRLTEHPATGWNQECSCQVRSTCTLHSRRIAKQQVWGSTLHTHPQKVRYMSCFKQTTLMPRLSAVIPFSNDSAIWYTMVFDLWETDKAASQLGNLFPWC